MRMTIAAAARVCAEGETCPAPAVVPVAAARPQGATGICKDGTYTTVHHYLGACSSNKGVAKWY